jgi:GGDEF domain-containing protein
MQQHSKILGFRVSAIIEAVLLLAIMLVIDWLFGAGNRFFDVNPHPFWLVVILLAVQYGTNEGLLAALLASFALFIGNFPVQPENIDRYDFLYDIFIVPILWFVFGWLIGEIRMRHVRERNRLRKELEESYSREELISESYSFVKNRKESLEVQVAGQLTSAIEAYRAAKAVETLDPKSVMQGIETLVVSVLGPQKFSLYLFHDNSLTATILHGWQQGDSYQQEIDSFSPLYQAVVGQQQTLIIANEEHERALDGQGLIAGPILDPETKRVVGMLKIEQMDFISMGLNTVESFKALSEWIGTALINARNYQTVKSEAMVNPERGILSYSYFQRQSDYLSKLAKRLEFNLTMLVIKINDNDHLNDSQRVTVARQIGESVRKVLRSVDLAFDYQTDGIEYSVLLPATPLRGANIVRDKISADLETATSNIPNVQFSYIVQSLHENS